MKKEKEVLATKVSQQIIEPVAPAVTSPAHLLQMAVAQDADINKLEKLMEMQERWEANEAKKAYAKAISLFRNDCPQIARTRKGHNNKYAGLSETLEEIQPVLSAHGLSHSWRTEQTDSLIRVICSVSHFSGHTESTSLAAAADTSGSKQPIQAIGSTVAYLQRYTLYAILGLSSREMDNDGEAVVEVITEDQVMSLAALIQEVGADRGKFMTYMGVTKLTDIYQCNYDKAVFSLERKRVKK